MDYIQKYMLWRTKPYFDEETREELFEIKDDLDEIRSRFEKELEFGTGGLRGVIGAGTNRMNIYIIRRVSQALSMHISEKQACSKGIVIGYDSRYKSPEFAAEAARVFITNGIKVYLFNEPRPTPMLSFAIRALHAAAGVMITASHNPKEYNGYKVYGEDGAQLSDTSAVANQIAKIKDITRIRMLDCNSAVKTGLFNIIGNEIDDAYICSIKSLLKPSNAVNKHACNVRIAYTPLHGIGGKTVCRALKEPGFGDLCIVNKQFRPDKNFPTLSETLNPEDEVVYKQALLLAKESDADLILATDPDCDRTGVMVKKNFGEYVLLSGNEAGALMLNYVLNTKQIPPNGFVAKTIVTTRLADKIAHHYGVQMEEVLTGFKYIGELIRKLHDTGEKKFIFGMEDSCGYLLGTDVRDKDGVIGCLLIAQTAAWYMSKGMSLYEGLKQLHKDYGYYVSDLRTYPIISESAFASLKDKLFSGIQGDVFSGLDITTISNYSIQKKRDQKSGKVTKLSLPKSDVIYYEFENGWFCIRPSGTESKIKMYIETFAPDEATAKEKLDKVRETVEKEINLDIL